MSQELSELLDSKKDEILKGKFIPTKENVIGERNVFSEYKQLNTQIIRGIKKNTNFKNLTKLRDYFEGKSLTAQLYVYLDSKKEDILKGKFIPSKNNIIAERNDFEEFKEINNRIAYWLKKSTLLVA